MAGASDDTILRRVGKGGAHPSSAGGCCLPLAKAGSEMRTFSNAVLAKAKPNAGAAMTAALMRIPCPRIGGSVATETWVDASPLQGLTEIAIRVRLAVGV
jgi:hypothetical protein